MGKRTEYINMLMLSLGLLISSSWALADRPAPPRDYTKTTENGEYIFVMLRPEDQQEKEYSDLRKKYKVSGLYRNDGSDEPLWTVDWYAFGVLPNSDGRHLIRWGPWASSTEQLALSFYEDGDEIKRYSIWELVCDETKLKHSVSHFQWLSEFVHDEDEGALIIVTHDDRMYRFQLETGEVQDDLASDGITDKMSMLCPKEDSRMVIRCHGKQHCESGAKVN